MIYRVYATFFIYLKMSTFYFKKAGVFKKIAILEEVYCDGDKIY